MYVHISLGIHARIQKVLFLCSFLCCVALPVYVPSMGNGQFTKPHFYLGKLEQVVNQYYVHILSLVTDNHPSGIEENDRRNYFMINLHESMGPDGIDRVTPGSGFRCPSVARHFTDCATRLGRKFCQKGSTQL